MGFISLIIREEKKLEKTSGMGEVDSSFLKEVEKKSGENLSL